MTNASEATERWDARPGSRIRGYVAVVPLAVYAFGLAAWMLLIAAIAPATFRRKSRSLLHLWGRGGLWFFGIRLEARGLEHLDAPGARIVLFNHQSLLDLFVLGALWPRDAVVIYKQEFHKVPIIGRLMKTLDFIAVDRSDRESAIRSMHAAGVRIRERGDVLLVAPEGTRSRADGLLPFKRGPFHLATETGLPLVPFIMQGVRSLMPAGRLVARPGVLRVDVLAPISTKAWVDDELDAQMRQVREVFLEYVPGATGVKTRSAAARSQSSGQGVQRQRQDAQPRTSGTDDRRPESTAAG